jgi:endonuclease/exonuclease/phosphatase family metal-dependent hydrolase
MIDVDLAIAGFPVLRIVATHLGLRRRERRQQMEILADRLDRSQKPLIVMGDFNEWHRFGYSMRVLDRIMGRNVSVRSYPACLPVVALDRIWVQPAAMLRRIASVKTPLTRRSSDHLPVVADVAWRGE